MGAVGHKIILISSNQMITIVGCHLGLGRSIKNSWWRLLKFELFVEFARNETLFGQVLAYLGC